MDMDCCDVLVVGAGPTGLMLAAELARYGMSCTIIDRSPTPARHSQALAIQPRTLELLHFLGIDHDFVEKGHKVHAFTLFGESSKIGRVAFSSLDSPFRYILSLPQSSTEEILTQHLLKLGLKVERELELVALEEVDSSVTATLQTPFQKKIQLSAKWVVGCDGAHSFVRKHLNLPFEGNAFPVVFSLADLELDWKYSHEEAFAFWNLSGILAAIPLPEKRSYRLIFTLERCQNSYQKLAEDNLQVETPPPNLKEIEKVVWQRADASAVLSNPKWITNFHVNSRLASHFRLGRCFLAGDAVHIHSPIGGQGMNTGLQDAFNLAWKIAFVHQEKMPVEILDFYHKERHAFAVSLVKRTEIGTDVAALKKNWKILFRNCAASMLLSIPFFQKKLIQSISQINITYASSKIIYEEGKFLRGPKAGSRMPNFSLQNGGSVLQVHDLFVNIDRFFIFVLLGNALGPTGLEEFWDKKKFLIKGIFIAKRSDRAVLTDQEGQMHHALGADEGACYVVRPDSYIGYRQTPIDPAALIAYFKKYEKVRGTKKQ